MNTSLLSNLCGRDLAETIQPTYVLLLGLVIPYWMTCGMTLSSTYELQTQYTNSCVTAQLSSVPVCVLVCHKEAEFNHLLQEGATCCRAGGTAPVSVETSQHCDVPRVLGRRWPPAVHCDGFLWRWWPLSQTETAEGWTAAWEAGGGVVCPDSNGAPGRSRPPKDACYLNVDVACLKNMSLF